MRPLAAIQIVLIFLSLWAVSCSNPTDSETNELAAPELGDVTVPENGASAESRCSLFLSAFAEQDTLVTTACEDEFLHLRSETGLPDVAGTQSNDLPMIGITAWIQRVALPFTYDWRIPMAPTWLDQPVEASARGPIAVAIDGVPIFHYERRPDVSTDLNNYDPANDTVVQGELDQCGGHAGQGDDYHYHYTPVCLLDEHDLAMPIAFGLDGAPVYFGEGGTDYYGRGRYNDWSFLPGASLDDCNALQLSDGQFVHFSTKTPPYLIGCHHGAFEAALQIEPRPLPGREQGVASPFGGQYGEPVNTEITSFSRDASGAYRMEFAAIDGSGNTSAILYRPVEGSDNCWEFEFRINKDQPGTVNTSCRENSISVGSVNANSFVHTHDHSKIGPHTHSRPHE